VSRIYGCAIASRKKPHGKKSVV